VLLRPSWKEYDTGTLHDYEDIHKPPGSPGVILVQMENEYDYANYPDDVKIAQVKSLAQDARADGIDVPLISCWTHQVRGSNDPVLRQIFDCVNFYPRWNVEGEVSPVIKNLRREQPDAPLATTELQGGWFSEVGGKLSENQDGLTASQINNLTLFVIQNGETIMNYYMLFGGSNFGDRGGRNITTTYDYGAPIREWGGVGDRYQRVWAIGHFLLEHGAKLARATAVDCDVNTSQKDVIVVERRAKDGSRYLFIRTSQHDASREGTATLKEKSGDEIVFDYQLEPFGSKILYLPPGATNAAQGEWFPKTAPVIKRPMDLPAGVTISSAKMKADPSPSHWTKLKFGEDLAHAGIDDSGFVFYQTKISSAAKTNLIVVYPQGDDVLATANGKIIDRAAGSSVFELPAGSSTVRLLYENHGHSNFGNDIGQPYGIFGARLTGSAFGTGKEIGGWRMQAVRSITNRPEVQPDFQDDDWANVDVSSVNANQLAPGTIAVFRASIDLTPTDLGGKTILSFGRVDDLGWVYLNRKEIGETIIWSKSYSFDVSEQLHAGRNVVAVIVQNTGGGGGLGSPMLEKPGQMTIATKSLGGSAGIEKGWWKLDFDDKKWKKINLGPDSPDNGALLTWYRMQFELQPAKPSVWVPWRLHLEATGNGFLYLNNHALGRYWQAGPQHDFFLPECWLNFGAGKTNVIALSLRPLDKGAAIQSAIIETYSEFAEQRQTNGKYERAIDEWYFRNDSIPTASQLGVIHFGHQ
jgi:hypothetical protein